MPCSRAIAVRCYPCAARGIVGTASLDSCDVALTALLGARNHEIDWRHMNQTAIDLFGEEVDEIESQYFDLIDKACENWEAQTISNSVPKHAVYLIHTFLTNAKSTVRLLTGSLSRIEGGVQVYANSALADAACAFLSRPGTRFLVVLLDEVDGGGEPRKHPFVKAILKQTDWMQQGTFELRQCKQLDDLDMHWMTMDDKAYRLEYDTKNVKAYADFGDPDNAQVLNELFDNVFFPKGKDLLAPA